MINDKLHEKHPDMAKIHHDLEHTTQQLQRLSEKASKEYNSEVLGVMRHLIRKQGQLGLEYNRLLVKYS